MSSRPAILLLALLLFASPTAAEIPLAVLNFELKDLTLLPGTEAELERTAFVAPLLRDQLRAVYGYRIVVIDAQAQERADVATGYLFDHADVAAELCQQHRALWIVVGRVHKPSFLFAYLKARLINCKTKTLAENFTLEVKGDAKETTRRGVKKLAAQIDQAIRGE